MAFHVLSAKQSDAIFECVRAACREDIFEEWEFPTLMGVERAEMRAIADNWPPATVDSHVGIAVNNALVNLGSYPLDAQQVASLPLSPEEAWGLRAAWKAEREYWAHLA